MSTDSSLLNQRTPVQTALLILEMRRQRDVELGKPSTRFRISARTLRVLSGRSRIRETFVDELQEVLASQHLKQRWLMMPVEDGYALVTMDAVNDWPRISSKRLTASGALSDQLETGRIVQDYSFMELASKFTISNSDAGHD